MVILRDTVPRPGRAGSRALVVLIHGWGIRPSEIFGQGVAEAIAEAIPDADLLMPEYPTAIRSNADPRLITKELAACIRDADRERGGYEEIILIGFSLGSLLVRKVYVYARGETHDIVPDLRVAEQDWAGRVSRIILLSGINRGWSLATKPEHMSRSFYLAARTISGVVKWLPLARLGMSVQRGEPFVANMRVQWMNLGRGGRPPAPTIQILGSRDEVVTNEDNVDIQICRDFKFLEVRETSHRQMVDFREDSIGPVRKEVFLRALLTPIGELDSDFLPDPQVEADVEHVIFIMHGIRDFGHWTDRLGQQVLALAQGEGIKVRVETSSYGYFPLLGFLMPYRRRKNVRWFMDLYTEMRARYPNARMHFIGHSNGTYLLADAMRRYTACDFDRVVFAGSVVPRHFPWNDLAGHRRVAAIRNDLASNDLVVATFPRFIEQFFELIGRPDRSEVGSGGVNGFLDGEGRRFQNCYFRGGHGAAVKPGNFDSLARFVLDRPSAQPDPALLVGEQSFLSGLLTRFCSVVWLSLAAVVFATAFGLAALWQAQAWVGYPVAPLAIVVAAVWLLLSIL